MANRCSFKKTIAYVGFVLYFLLLLQMAMSLETPAARSHSDLLVPSSVTRSPSERSPFDPSIPSSILIWLARA